MYVLEVFGLNESIQTVNYSEYQSPADRECQFCWHAALVITTQIVSYACIDVIISLNCTQSSLQILITILITIKCVIIF